MRIYKEWQRRPGSIGILSRISRNGYKRRERDSDGYRRAIGLGYSGGYVRYI